MDPTYRMLAEGFTAQVFDWGPGEVLKLYRPPFAAVAAKPWPELRAAPR